MNARTNKVSILALNANTGQTYFKTKVVYNDLYQLCVFQHYIILVYTDQSLLCSWVIHKSGILPMTDRFVTLSNTVTFKTVAGVGLQEQSVCIGT